MKKFTLINLSALVLLACTFFACKKVDEVVPVTYAPVTISKTPRVIKPKTIVVLGSSTAAGYGASTMDSSWVNRLNSKLVANNQGKVINLAIPGFSTYEIMPNGYVPGYNRNTPPNTNNNITKALSYHPDFIIISLPSNDIARSYYDKEIMDNFKKITGTLDSLNIPYVLTGLQPRAFAPEVRKRLITINQYLLKTYTWHVNDFYDRLNDGDNKLRVDMDSGDGIHPNNKGHKLIYESFFSCKWFMKLLNA